MTTTTPSTPPADVAAAWATRVNQLSLELGLFKGTAEGLVRIAIETEVLAGVRVHLEHPETATDVNGPLVLVGKKNGVWMRLWWDEGCPNVGAGERLPGWVAEVLR
jgi:hypothetical protein